ncbi:hypothetical protein K491DRAFT_719957 [Lophiostoma macrostomum CBS 122681]|uniref:Uncharacterized protein n=1 Tax=Lophiostoma macrostomum CBS 122681 TaxID=1314788 RepID=A0A6A6SWF5_9PLEO|nr:hypothetical protein K491DRAFT_719957 [Lophiostoma macrostomum CBS 122681]
MASGSSTAQSIIEHGIAGQPAANVSGAEQATAARPIAEHAAAKKPTTKDYRTKKSTARKPTAEQQTRAKQQFEMMRQKERACWAIPTSPSTIIPTYSSTTESLPSRTSRNTTTM